MSQYAYVRAAERLSHLQVLEHASLYEVRRYYPGTVASFIIMQILTTAAH